MEIQLISVLKFVFIATLLALGIIVPGVAQAAGPCANTPAINRTPAIGSPFANPDVTRMDTQTSDNVRVTGGCVDAVVNGQLYAAASYKGVTSKALCKWNSTEDVGDCIQGAINAASAAGGGVVMVPAGSYNQTTLINIPSRVCVAGAGASQSSESATILTWGGASGGTMIQIGSSAGASVYAPCIKNIQLDGNGTAAYNIRMWAVLNGVFENVRLGDVTTAAWYIDANASSGTQSNRFFNVDFRLCSLAAKNADGFLIGPGTSSKDTFGNTWIGGNSTLGLGRSVVWGGSDFNQMYGGLYHDCGNKGAESAVVSAAGSGYTNGDVVTLTTAVGACSPAPTFTLTVSGGTVTTVAPANTYSIPYFATLTPFSGYCTSGDTPANPAAVTGGTGTGLTLDVTYATVMGRMEFSGQADASGQHSRGNVLFGTSVGTGGVGGILSTAGAAGLLSASKNVQYGRKTTDGQPIPVCDEQGSASDVPTFYSQTLGGNISSCGGLGWQLAKPRIRYRLDPATADTTLTTDDAARIMTNDGASGAVVFTLPAADETGRPFCFRRVANQTIRVRPDPTTGNVIRLNDAVTSSAGSAGGYIESVGNDSYICLMDSSNAVAQWRVTEADNVWITDTGLAVRWGHQVDATGSVLFDPGSNTEKTATAAQNWTNDTFVTVPGLAIPLQAGKAYKCDGWLTVSASGAGGGIKLQVTGTGGLTTTGMRFYADLFSGATRRTPGTISVSAFNTVFGDVTNTVDQVWVRGTITAGVAGTLELQVAQNVTDATTLTVGSQSALGCVRTN